MRMRRSCGKAGDSTPEPSALSMSVGVANYPDDGADAEDLLAEADRRMYKSKRLRKKARAGDSLRVLPHQRRRLVTLGRADDLFFVCGFLRRDYEPCGNCRGRTDSIGVPGFARRRISSRRLHQAHRPCRTA